MQIKVATPETAEWDAAVRIVREKYRKAFAADVHPHPDRFVVCLEDDGPQPRAVACAGLTFSRQTPLFSEAYLDTPAHRAIGQQEGQPVAREAVLEVGALASVSYRAGTELIRALPLLCWCLGKRYILCTATRPLRALFEDVGICFTPLVQADPQRLDAGALAAWGSYYRQSPQTGFVSLEQMSRQFGRFTGRYSFFNPVVQLAEPQPQPQRQPETPHAFA
ncbi:thermostable hemolysin [Ideonella livida]|uniref:Thermostable hemolysin n=1 Tax=Ideonella livida TaxID=2707176 RepID=A0A7C9PHF5_9BURK|nr:thermostable hemolysin [Ideonella livida]NDY91828.1 hypothetical protein [Ideonella livida]